MADSDIAQLLELVAGTIAHPALTPGALKDTQAQVKAFIADKADLQDPDLLIALDKILKYGTASQVPATFIPPSFNLADYVAEPEPAPTDQPPLEVLPPPEDAPVSDSFGG